MNEFSRMLGAIEARLSHIEDEQKEERISWQQHRSDLRIIIASQATATIGLSSKLDGVSTQMVEMKVLTDDYKENRAQGRGIVKVIRFAWVLVAAAAASLGAWVSKHWQ